MVNFPAQIANVHVHDIRITIEVEIPDVLNDLCACEHLVWMAQKELQR